MEQPFDFASLKDTICTLITGPYKNDFAQGILIRPDIVLTACHVVDQAEHVRAFNTKNEKAWLLLNNRENKYNFELDAALVKLSKPLSGRAVPYAVQETGLDLMQGMLLTRFNEQSVPLSGNVSIHSVGINREVAEWDEKLKIRTFFSEASVRGGYSGSPIFNNRGEISSLVSGTRRLLDNGSLLWAHPPKNFAGPQPEKLGAFLSKSFDH